MRKIHRKKLYEARDIFEAMLKTPRTKEAQWQQFFTDHPFVLSRALPLDLSPEHIIPQARPGRSEPDFLFYPWNTPSIPYYGVVELKRPDSRILTTPRENIALLTRDADCAIEQGKQYAKEFGLRIRSANRSLLCLGNMAYIFIIMGLSEEIAQKLGEKLFREQIEDRLPKNLQLLPYDVLFERFASTILPQVMFLVPLRAIRDEKLSEELDEEMWEPDFGRPRNCG